MAGGGVLRVGADQRELAPLDQLVTGGVDADLELLEQQGVKPLGGRSIGGANGDVREQAPTVIGSVSGEVARGRSGVT
jgi:hypothetical protein